MSETDTLVIDTKKEPYLLVTVFKKYGALVIVAIVIVLIVLVIYIKTDTFTSPDGVVASGGKSQKRSDPGVDKSWNLKQLEKTVASINRIEV
jgi:hypothetical protein